LGNRKEKITKNIMNPEKEPLKSAAELAVEGPTELESSLDAKTSIDPELVAEQKIYAEQVEAQDAKDAEKKADLRKSMGLEQPADEVVPKNAENEKTILEQQIDIFKEHIDNGNLKEGEAKLIELEEQIKANQLDHLSLLLFRGARTAKLFDIAKRMIRLAETETGRKGRVKAWEKDSGQTYDEIIEADPEQDIESMDQTKTSYFDALIKAGRLEDAEIWLMDNKNGEKYGENHKWLLHTSGQLFKRYREQERWPEAKRMIEILPDGQAKDDRKEKLVEEAKISYDQI
jgi:hypothetical protein